MNKLPTGTITFLFTDVVGNVPIWERDPTAMKAALGRHHDIRARSSMVEQWPFKPLVGSSSLPTLTDPRRRGVYFYIGR
jgi:hypothetical protein